jgi:hypothetical protein
MLRLIGDVHGRFDDYHDVVSAVEHSLCLGDFGFSSEWNRLYYSGLDPAKHKILAGNHEPYDMAPESPFYLGDFGTATLGGVSFFFVRGGISLDRAWREVERPDKGRSWWPQEELNFSQMLACMKAYKKAKPDIIISHTPCSTFTKIVCSDPRILLKYGFPADFSEATQLLIDELLKIHTPKVCFSGHLHKDYTTNIGMTKFVSLDILQSIDIDEYGKLD